MKFDDWEVKIVVADCGSRNDGYLYDIPILNPEVDNVWFLVFRRVVTKSGLHTMRGFVVNPSREVFKAYHHFLTLAHFEEWEKAERASKTTSHKILRVIERFTARI